MKSLIRSVWRFMQDESGPTSVEYCFMLGFIVLVCISAIVGLGEATHAYYTRSLDKM